jgi:phosphatidylserine decarboxylase
MDAPHALKQEIQQRVGRLEIWAYRALPRRLFSETVEWAGKVRVPSALRRMAFGLFASLYGIDPSEAEKELTAYESFNDFFTRRLRCDARQSPADERVALCPSDSTVVQAGRVEHDSLLQAKGLTYSLGELLGAEQRARPFRDGKYVTLYLRPRDYHRVHSPVGGRIEEVWHIPGERFPVVPAAVREIPGLYSQNERVVILIDTPALGRVAVVMVAALGVGNMTLHWTAEPVRAISPAGRATRLKDLEGHSILAGGELGAFNLGSTVVLVFEPDRFRLGDVQTGQRVFVGQPIAYPA